MPMLNPFEGDAFSAATLTDEINTAVVAPRQAGELGWDEKGLTIPHALIDRKHEGLDIVDSAPYNGVPTQLTITDGEPISLYVPSHPAESTLYAAEVTARRAHGTENDLETVEARKQEHYKKHNSAHALTLEVDRVGALLGKVLNRDGSTKYDLGASFGVAPLVQEVDFANNAFNPFHFFQDLIELQGDQADGAMIDGWDVILDGPTMAALTKNKIVVDLWTAYRNANTTSDVRKRGFEIIEGVFVKRYANNSIVPGSNGRKIFPVNGLVIPRIDGNLQTRFAPRQDLEFQHTIGIPVYMIPTVMKRNEGIELYSESNHLSYARRLELHTELQLKA